MSSPVPESHLETALAAVEQRLSALGMALCVRDTVGIDLHSTELHRALGTDLIADGDDGRQAVVLGVVVFAV